MLRWSGRVRKILVAVLVALVVIGAMGLAILPEIVRRVVVSQAAKITGRVLSLEDVDLNLFTGHLALKGGKVLKRGMNERAFEFERLDVRVDYLPLVLRHVRVTELTLVAPTLNIVRRGGTRQERRQPGDLGRRTAEVHLLGWLQQGDDSSGSGVPNSGEKGKCACGGIAGILTQPEL